MVGGSTSRKAFITIAGGFITGHWYARPEPDWDALETWSQMKYGRFIREAGCWPSLQDLLEVVHRSRSGKKIAQFSFNLTIITNLNR